MIKIIVLEGCDGAGKSTFADNLQALYAAAGWDTWRMHFGVPDESIGVVDTYAKPIYEWVIAAEDKGGHNLLIVDRLHIGEIVYGYMLRDGNRMTEEQRETVEDMLILNDAQCFYLAPGLDVIMERFDARGDDLISADQLAQISTMYDQLLLDNSMWTVADQRIQNLVKDLADATRRVVPRGRATSVGDLVNSIGRI